jgi:hypothetical protein
MTLALTAVELAAVIRDIVLITFFVIGVFALLIGLFLGLGFYRRIRHLVDRVDAGVDRVEAMVDTVDSTASSVKNTATSMNRGMRAGGFARSAVSSVFGRSAGDGKPNGKQDHDE